MRCSNCGSENPVNRKFCGECGAPFKCPKMPSPVDCAT